MDYPAARIAFPRAGAKIRPELPDWQIFNSCGIIFANLPSTARITTSNPCRCLQYADASSKALKPRLEKNDPIWKAWSTSGRATSVSAAPRYAPSRKKSRDTGLAGSTELKAHPEISNLTARVQSV